MMHNGTEMGLPRGAWCGACCNMHAHTEGPVHRNEPHEQLYRGKVGNLGAKAAPVVGTSADGRGVQGRVRAKRSLATQERGGR